MWLGATAAFATGPARHILRQAMADVACGLRVRDGVLHEIHLVSDSILVAGHLLHRLSGIGGGRWVPGRNRAWIL